jgi:hypothetical protein
MARRNKKRARGLPKHASVVPSVPPAATSLPVVDETMVGVAEAVPVIFLSDESNEDTNLAVAPPEEVNSDVLGSAINLAWSPLEEGIENLDNVMHFLGQFNSTPLRRVLRYWHPGVSENGLIPDQMLDYQFIVMNLRKACDDGDDHHTTNMALLIQFYQQIWPSNDDSFNIADVIPRCQTLMIRSTSKIIAAISFISCPGSWNTMVTQLGVAADCRGCGYGTFLLVALQKALLIPQMDDGPATVYLQCLDSRHEDTVYPFFRVSKGRLCRTQCFCIRRAKYLLASKY